MLRKILIIFSLLFLSYSGFAQSKWSTEAGGGTALIKKDVSPSVFFGIAYQVSEHVKINLSTLYANPKYEITNEKYDFNQVSLESEYSFTPQNNINISSIAGFSYVHFGSKIDLKHNDGIGMNLGVIVAFDNIEKISYGTRIVNTFSNVSYGGIFTANLFLRFNF